MCKTTALIKLGCEFPCVFRRFTGRKQHGIRNRCHSLRTRCSIETLAKFTFFEIVAYSQVRKNQLFQSSAWTLMAVKRNCLIPALNCIPELRRAQKIVVQVIFDSVEMINQ